MSLKMNNFSSDIEIGAPGLNQDTFTVRMQGDAMSEAGINDNDLLRVKTGVIAREGNIVLAMVEHDLLVRRYFLDNGKPVLMADNVNYPSMLIDEWDQFEICGVIETR